MKSGLRVGAAAIALAMGFEDAGLLAEGMKAELMGDVEGATRLFEAVIEVDSSHAPSYFELAGLMPLVGM